MERWLSAIVNTYGEDPNSWPSFNISNASNLRIQFWVKFLNFEPGESAGLSVSQNGSDFFTIKEWKHGQDDGIYRYEDIDLSSYESASQLWVKFFADMNSVYDLLFIDDRSASPTRQHKLRLTMSYKKLCRLTVPPGVWVAFRCIGQEDGVLMNFADIPHDPSESLRQDISRWPIEEFDN